jgi:hypothetical protein
MIPVDLSVHRKLAVNNSQSNYLGSDMGGTVAAMTEGDPGVESERISRNIPG